MSENRDLYPPTYRQSEVSEICSAVQSGECVQVIGLSGAGKSNLSRFLTAQAPRPPVFLLADCNRLKSPALNDFAALIAAACGADWPENTAWPVLEATIGTALAHYEQGICLVLDRFEAVQSWSDSPIPANLRALRDQFKYQLTYVLTTRQPIDTHSELAELFFAHTLWLGPLSEKDAAWSIKAYAARRKVAWSEETVQAIYRLSGGYPAFLRAVCEAHASGTALEKTDLLEHPAVRRRLDEFLAQAPGAEAIECSRLDQVPLLGGHAALQELTAKEAQLYAFLQANAQQVCSKDDLIRAVWPEDRVYSAGVRDDSLAQLVRRLRQKIESDPAHPQRLQTIPGRGYRFTG